MRHILLAACAVLCLASPVHAAPKPPPLPHPVCTKSGPVIDRIKALIEADGHSELMIYSDERAGKIRDAINALPPPTGLTADRVLVLLRHDHEHPSAMIMFETAGCITHAFPPLAENAYRKMMSAALGEAI